MISIFIATLSALLNCTHSYAWCKVFSKPDFKCISYHECINMFTEAVASILECRIVSGAIWINKIAFLPSIFKVKKISGGDS